MFTNMVVTHVVKALLYQKLTFVFKKYIKSHGMEILGDLFADFYKTMPSQPLACDGGMEAEFKGPGKKKVTPLQHNRLQKGIEISKKTHQKHLRPVLDPQHVKALEDGLLQV